MVPKTLKTYSFLVLLGQGKSPGPGSVSTMRAAGEDVSRGNSEQWRHWIPSPSDFLCLSSLTVTTLTHFLIWLSLRGQPPSPAFTPGSLAISLPALPYMCLAPRISPIPFVGV